MGTLEIAQCDHKILETKLDFVLTLCYSLFLSFFGFFSPSGAQSKISDKQIFLIYIFC